MHHSALASWRRAYAPEVHDVPPSFLIFFYYLFAFSHPFFVYVKGDMENLDFFVLLIFFSLSSFLYFVLFISIWSLLFTAENSLYRMSLDILFLMFSFEITYAHYL